jgi:hypothetical protein
MNSTQTMLEIADSADQQAVAAEGDGDHETAAVWAQISTARSIAALATAAQAIADALDSSANSHFRPPR